MLIFVFYSLTNEQDKTVGNFSIPLINAVHVLSELKHIHDIKPPGDYQCFVLTDPWAEGSVVWLAGYQTAWRFPMPYTDRSLGSGLGRVAGRISNREDYQCLVLIDTWGLRVRRYGWPDIKPPGDYQCLILTDPWVEGSAVWLAGIDAGNSAGPVKISRVKDFPDYRYQPYTDNVEW